MTKILVVEDNKTFYEFLIKKLSSLYEVSGAMTAKEAIEKIKLLPDVVILDMEFPKEPGRFPEDNMGLEVLEEIKKTNPKTQVIILSSTVSVNCEDIKRKGAFKCLIKDAPGVFEKLLDAIKKCLEKS